MIFLLGTTLAVVVWRPSLILPVYFRFNPPRRYHYYYLEPRSATDSLPWIAGGVLLALAGLWLFIKRPSINSGPKDSEQP